MKNIEKNEVNSNNLSPSKDRINLKEDTMLKIIGNGDDVVKNKKNLEFI